MTSTVAISKIEDGIKIQRWFMRHFPQLTIGEFRKLCRTGQIRVNAGRVRGNETLYADDIVRVPPMAAAKVESRKPKAESGARFSMADLEKLRKRIIHDDADIVVFDKPAGLAVQGGTGIKKSMDKMVAAMFPHDNIMLVHRLDRETSGIIIIAKNQIAAQKLSEEFRDKKVVKEYLALLSGTVKSKRGTIDNYMAKGRIFANEEVEVFRDAGLKPQRAITKYRVLYELKDGALTLMQFFPETGRTHQLRLHSAFSLHAPIVGDKLYSPGNPAETAILTCNDHLFLLARRLTFFHPASGEQMTLSVPVPEFMKSVLKLIGYDKE